MMNQIAWAANNYKNIVILYCCGHLNPVTIITCYINIAFI